MRSAVPVLLSFLFLSSCSTHRETIPEPPVDTVETELPAPEPKERVRYVPVDKSEFPHLFLSPRETSPANVALRADQMVVTQEEYRAGLENYRSADGDGDGEEEYQQRIRDELLLLAWLRDSGLTNNEQFEARARSLLRSQLASLVLDEAVRKSVSLSPGESRSYYDANIADFRQPHRVGVRVILVATMAEAEEVMAQLEQGEEFAALAQARSLHSSGASGGRLESFARGTLSTQIEDVAFNLGTGEIGTASTPLGVWIIEKIADSPASEVPFEQVQADIERRLLDEKRLRARVDFLQQLADDYQAKGAGDTP